MLLSVCSFVVFFHPVGNFLHQQSPLFQEEFPQLASGGEEKSQLKRADEFREAQRGPVPDLKHQGACCLKMSLCICSIIKNRCHICIAVANDIC